MARIGEEGLARLRIWGIKDGQRVFIDQQGSSLHLDPEIALLRMSSNLEEDAKEYLDTVIDVWHGSWDTDR